ncbi:MAG: DUF177 domain-containing protein [Acidimicrobiia bacterium]|nr:DUF177 domain-containing protein [Acidimicrobiia bacterium]
MSADAAFEVVVADLLRQPGVRRSHALRAPLGRLETVGSATPSDAEVVAELVLEATGGTALVVEGTVSAPWRGSCRRCLDDVDGVLEADLREIFERRPTEGETYLLGEDRVDLEPMVRDAVALALPLAPLCDEDCAGPAPDRFPARSSEEEPAAPPRDPRWAALDDVHFDN